MAENPTLDINPDVARSAKEASERLLQPIEEGRGGVGAGIDAPGCKLEGESQMGEGAIERVDGFLRRASRGGGDR